MVSSEQNIGAMGKITLGEPLAFSLFSFPPALRAAPPEIMGKKSKRRGGTSSGGGKKGTAASSGAARGSPAAARSSGSARDQPGRGARGNSNNDASIDALALLESVTEPLPSLRGIVSTNHDLDECALCSGPLVFGRKHVVVGCCGKLGCDACYDADRFGPRAVDLLGQVRCAFCNSLKSKEVALLRDQAISGMVWAQHLYGTWLDEKTAVSSDRRLEEEAASWYKRAASRGHPEAFLGLSDLYKEGRGCPFDLKLAQAYAKKARALHPFLGLRCNQALVRIAKEHVDNGSVEEALAILLEIANETDTSALKGNLCDNVAMLFYELEEFQFAANMLTDAFCLGQVKAALCASAQYFMSEKYTLCKLWLSIACQTKHDYVNIVLADDGTKTTRSWSDDTGCRDEIRTELRQNRNSCGGCGAALQGDMRKYCRGCKAHCYCSRECQKLHWNRKKDSHRDECKEAKEHWGKVMEAIRIGKVILSKKNKQA